MAAFRAALEAGDPAAAWATFADEAVLRSTATDRIRFTGAELKALLAAVGDAYEDLRIVHGSASEGSFTLVLAARIGRRRFQETIVARVDRTGMIEVVHASVRPLGGLLAVTTAIGVRLARRRGRVAAWSFRGLMVPLQALAAVGDVIGARLAVSPSSRVRRSKAARPVSAGDDLLPPGRRPDRGSLRASADTLRAPSSSRSRYATTHRGSST